MNTNIKSTARRIYEEGWNARNMGVIDQLIAKDHVEHDPAHPSARGPNGMKGIMQIYLGAFADLRMTVDAQIAEGDLVVTRWTARGTHSGNLMGAAPTNRKVTVSGITVMQIKDGKIQESWSNWDTAGLMQSIGVMPTTTATGATTGSAASGGSPAMHK